MTSLLGCDDFIILQFIRLIVHDYTVTQNNETMDWHLHKQVGRGRIII